VNTSSDPWLLHLLESSLEAKETTAIVGAGLPASLGWPTSAQLLSRVTDELEKYGVKETFEDLGKAVDALDRAAGRLRGRCFLRDALRDWAGTETHDVKHALIARGFRHVLTTNWDCSFDIVYMSHLESYNIVPCVCPTGPASRTVPDWTEGAKYSDHHLIKLHGTIAIPASMIASESDITQLAAVTTDAVTHPFARWLNQILLENRVFIIGYRLSDISLVVPYLSALRRKDASQPDYFVYHSYDEPGPRAQIENALKGLWRSVELFPGTTDQFFDALRHIDTAHDPDGGRPAWTRWGAPPRAPEAVGHEAQARSVQGFLAKPSATLCVVAAHPGAGASTFASGTLRMAADIVGVDRTCWIECKDYLPLSAYQSFVEQYLRSREDASDDNPDASWWRSDDSAEDAADRIIGLLRATLGRTVFILEQFQMAATNAEVVAFFKRLISASSRQLPMGRAQFIAFVAFGGGGLPPPFSGPGGGRALCPTVHVVLQHMSPDNLLQALQNRLDFPTTSDCSALATMFASEFPIGTAVPATVLLTTMKGTMSGVETARDVMQLLAGVRQRDRLDTLLDNIVGAIHRDDPELCEFMLRCSVFRAPRYEGALRTALPSEGRAPLELAARLVQYGILAEGHTDPRDGPSYAMSSSVRRFLARRPESMCNQRRWNSIAAKYYADQACRFAVSREEALELLAAAFHHSRVAGDYGSFLRALQERRRDLVGAWHLPVIEHWLDEISKLWETHSPEERVAFLLLQLRVARSKADPAAVQAVCEQGMDLTAGREGLGEELAQFKAGLGVAHWFRGEPDQAAGKFREARDVAEGVKANDLAVQLTLRLARCYTALISPGEAWAELTRADSALDRLASEHSQDHNRAVHRSHCADLACFSERYDEAIRWADECLELNMAGRRTYGLDRTGCAIAWLTKARVSLSRGENADAVRQAEEAVLLLREPPSSAWWTSVSLLTRAEAQARCGDSGEAETALADARAVWRHVGTLGQSPSPDHAVQIKYIRGLMALNRQRYDEALDLLGQVVEQWWRSPELLRCAPDVLAAMLAARRTHAGRGLTEILDRTRDLSAQFRDAYNRAWPVDGPTQ